MAELILDNASNQLGSLGENFDEMKISGEIVTSLTQDRILALVPEQYQGATVSVSNLGFTLANAYLLPPLSTAIGISINPISAISMDSIALAQIKGKLENMDKSLILS